MNKTVSINLGGFYFHIDEDAFQKLNRYFDAIKRSLSADTRDEIMSDIEGRIAELLSEKLKSDKQVVGSREIEEIIAVMGQPEDYRIDEDVTGEKKSGEKTSTDPFGGAADYRFLNKKKFYRDTDRGMLGGVCAGLSHYLRIDPLWLRIAFVLALTGFGTGIFIYLLLWILIPRAVTTTEKLEMTGEPINISNIERKVKEEVDILTAKLNKVDYDKLGQNAKYGAEKIGSGIGTVFSAIFKVIGKIVGAFIVIFSAVSLGSIIVLFISLLFTASLTSSMWHPWLGSFNYTETPVWIMGMAAFFAAAIPLFMLFLLGLKILVDNLRPIGNITRFTLLGIWILSLVAVIYFGLRQASEISSEGKTVSKQELNYNTDDVLLIKFRYNDYFAKSLNNNRDFSIKQDSLGNEIIYSNNISFNIMKTDESKPFIQIEKLANGNNTFEARKRAEKIKYGFKLEGNTLMLDNYLLSDISNKYRNQRIEIYLYLPTWATFKCEESVKKYDTSDDSFFNLWWDSSDHIYQMQEDKVQCLDCPVDENGEIIEGVEDINIEDVEGIEPPEPPAPPVIEHVRINAGGKGEVHISNKKVDIQVKIDSMNVSAKGKRQ